MNLTLGFSTCPNDTFIFEAMVKGKIDTEGLSFNMVLSDVEELNRMALLSELDVTKLSFHAFAHVSNNYVLLDSGSALGKNNGPLLVSKTKVYPDEVKSLKIAIPGKYTTASLLLGIAYPDARNTKEYLFSEIEEAILSNEVDAGVIIHESRFTYKEKGLMKISDLGELWEKSTKMNVPLGCIAVKRDLPQYLKEKINRVLYRSVEFALQNPKESYNFVKQYAQEMDDEVIRKHIELYVNDFTKNLGKHGREAVCRLFEEAVSKGVVPALNENIFLS